MWHIIGMIAIGLLVFCGIVTICAALLGAQVEKAMKQDRTNSVL